MPYLTIILCGDTRREMEEWITALRNITLRNSNSDILDRLSDGHNWYSRSHSRPTLCNVCGELLPGVTSRGLSCEVCTYTVHKQCAVRAVDKCKWTSLETIGNKEKLSEYSDPFAMAHQWMQLNISPGSRCYVCDKSCGGKKNPQDRKCLWCGLSVHSFCESSSTARAKCSLGENNLSILPPTALAFSAKPGMLMEATRPHHGNPLLVFVNTRSGDNQGVKFLRKFKQLLNPAQVFDLSFGGPAQGLKLFQHLDLFRVLVCGGDGSVGWVMTEIDKMKLMKKCQISVLPLGTGNDLSRVLRWGASFYDTNALPYLLKSLEGAKTEMLDRWSIMIQEEKEIASSPSSSYSLSSQAELTTPSEASSFNTMENDIGKHLSRIMYSHENTEVISSARVLCGIVKNLVSKVGAASASEESNEPGQPDELSQKCSVLNDKLDQLLHTLNVEEEAVRKPEECGQLSASGNPKVFVPRDALMSRANSLKKALRQIIDHTEQAVDEQNAQTSNDFAQSIVTAATTAVSDAQVPNIVAEDNRYEHRKSLSDIPEGSSVGGLYPERYSPRLLSRSSPQRSESALDELKVESKQTVHFPGTIIAKAFLKEKENESYGPGSSMIYKALIANVDTLCAAASPVPDNFISVEGFTERCVMNNYFSVGMDAKIVLEFHLKREENPEQFRSRKLNLIHYGVLGGKEMLQNSFKNLDQRVHIEVDGHKLHLPRLQGIVVLNIPSYMSGSNFWGSWKDDDGFTTPSFDDKIIEVVAIFSCSQMGVAKVFGGMPYYRMAQCRSVKITITDEAVPVQVDGEPWMQPPGVIKIVHKNRAQMLVRDA
ncbi:diacylglycerol kinase delta-like, partial [Paramuricea clavata]